MTSWRIFFILLAVVAAGLAFVAGQNNRNLPLASGEQSADAARAKKEAEIEKTPAPDLMARDPKHDELRRDADGLKSRTKLRIYERINEFGKDRLGGRPTSGSEGSPGSGGGNRQGN